MEKDSIIKNNKQEWKVKMMEYLKDVGYFDITDKEIHNLLFENKDKIERIDWNNIVYRNFKGLEFQVKFYELAKYTRYLESFIQHLKNVNRKKGYKKLPKDFYNSYDWANVRILILTRANFKCKHCGNLANHVDHINSAKYFPEMALDPTNLISSCEDCHKKRQKRGFENKT